MGKLRQRVQCLVWSLVCLLLTSCQVAAAPAGLALSVDRVVTAQLIEVEGVHLRPDIQVPVQLINAQVLEGESATPPDTVESVQLIGIEAPDLNQQPWGEVARAKLSQWIGNQPVLLESDVESRLPDGRRLAYVWQRGELLNEKLVAEGYALAVSQTPNQKYDRRLSRAQDRARILGLGIWNPQQPMTLTPEQFRQTKTKEG